MRVTVKAYDDGVADALNSLGDAGEKAAKAALAAVMPGVAERARGLAPVQDVDGGQLRASVRVLRPTKTRDGVAGGVLAGGAPLVGQPGGDVYALVQHEDLTLHHNDGQAKFVERPFLAAQGPLLASVREHLDREAKKGGGR